MVNSVLTKLSAVVGYRTFSRFEDFGEFQKEHIVSALFVFLITPLNFREQIRGLDQ